jgi:hypothetical protein
MTLDRNTLSPIRTEEAFLGLGAQLRMLLLLRPTPIARNHHVLRQQKETLVGMMSTHSTSMFVSSRGPKGRMRTNLAITVKDGARITKSSSITQYEQNS